MKVFTWKGWFGWVSLHKVASSLGRLGFGSFVGARFVLLVGFLKDMCCWSVLVVSRWAQPCFSGVSGCAGARVSLC